MNILKQFEKFGHFLNKWFTGISPRQTLTCILILLFVLITGETGLAFIAGEFESIKSLFKTNREFK